MAEIIKNVMKICESVRFAIAIQPGPATDAGAGGGGGLSAQGPLGKCPGCPMVDPGLPTDVQ